jgi:hypothetical protein
MDTPEAICNIRCAPACRCQHCGRGFNPRRRNVGTKFCSDACRQAAYRDRHPGRWALIVWPNPGRSDLRARFAFFNTRAAAAAAAPRDRVHTIVDRTVTARPHPSVEELLRTWTAAKTRAM